MKYNVNWLISGTINIDALDEAEAEKKIKSKLEDIFNKNKNNFEEVGATAIQGSAKLIE